ALGAGAQVLEAPRGRASQQNAGARCATGDFLLFLHADTWLADDTALQLAQTMEDSNISAGAFCQRIDASGWIYRWIEAGNAARVRWRGMAYGDQGIFVHRNLFESVGGFPDVPLMEDLLLMRRLRSHRPLRLLPGPLHVSPRRWKQNGVVRQTLRNWSLLAAERCGVSLDRLAGWYQPFELRTSSVEGPTSLVQR
ncbi:MAG: TIGR04283 family arsenosugar biosynthesis glycosyltransferase, partial [Aeoliella sp.]